MRTIVLAWAACASYGRFAYYTNDVRETLASLGQSSSLPADSAACRSSPLRAVAPPV